MADIVGIGSTRWLVLDAVVDAVVDAVHGILTDTHFLGPDEVEGAATERRFNMVSRVRCGGQTVWLETPTR
jgi:hypothetical protein